MVYTKNKKLLHVLALTLLWVVPAQHGMAFIGAQALLGIENATIVDSKIGSEDLDLTGNATALAIHLDPIPLIPIAFGLGLTLPDTAGKDSAKNDIVFSGFLVDLQVMAWAPVGLAGFKPYAKVGYTLVGAYVVDHKISNAVVLGGTAIDPGVAGSRKYTYSYETSGYQLAAGLRYSLLPLISLLLEVSTRSEQAKLNKVKLEGNPIDLGVDDFKVTSTNLMAGIQIGF